jgi:hypothetical protein
MYLTTFVAAAGLQSRGRRFVTAFLLLAAAAAPTFAASNADGAKPKLGPLAIPIQQSHDYLRTHDAPDYWRLSPYYVSQMSNSACSLATVVMLVNALRGLPPLASDRLVTQTMLRDAVASNDWARQTEERGEGVTWAEFKAYVAASLKAYGLDADIESFRPADASEATLAELRRLLAANEGSDADIALIYYNQGVVTGDWDGPHTSPVGAYDAEHHQVLIMDVDRQWYGPYWTSDETLLAAMLRPTPREHGILAGEIGGVVRVTVKRGRVN